MPIKEQLAEVDPGEPLRRHVRLHNLTVPRHKIRNGQSPNQQRVFVRIGGEIDEIGGSGISAEESGQVLRKIQSGKVRQYATLMFGAAAVLAGIFILAV